MIQVGQQAQLIQPVIQGVVRDTRFNKVSGELEHLVAYTDAAGEPQERWFSASELEAAEL